MFPSLIKDDGAAVVCSSISLPLLIMFPNTIILPPGFKVRDALVFNVRLLIVTSPNAGAITGSCVCALITTFDALVGSVQLHQLLVVPQSVVPALPVHNPSVEFTVIAIVRGSLSQPLSAMTLRVPEVAFAPYEIETEFVFPVIVASAPEYVQI